VELAAYRKMIQSSVGKDGAPRLDSVSLYSLGKLLGKGAFGAVKMGVHKLTGAVVAIKNFKKADVKNEVEARAIDREIRILKQSVHQHIIKLYEVIDSPTNWYLVMECAANGDLAGHLEKKGRLREAEAAKYLVQTVEAIGCCHANGFIHRDIKPENLLLDVHYDIKVTDFGGRLWALIASDCL
jgi:serine/threonine protein kinase